MSLNTQEAEDKRLFERFQARFPAKIKDSAEDFGNRLTLRNASAQGARLTSKERFYINDSLTLEVVLPDGLDPMNIKGQVVWVKEKESHLWDVGLKFHTISLMSMNRLYKFVAPPSPSE